MERTDPKVYENLFMLNSIEYGINSALYKLFLAF